MRFQTKSLGELCEFQGGSQPPKSNFIYEPKNGYVRFLQIRDFGGEKNHTYIPESKKNKICNSDDIMIGRYGASVGKILRGKSGAYNVALMKATPSSNLIIKDFFWLYLNSALFQDDLRTVASRSAQDGFSKDDIFNFQVPLPPVVTQQKIVAKLDAIFSEIDKAKAAAEANAKNAEALFQSYLERIFQSQDENWITSKLKDVCEKITDGTHQTPTYFDDGVIFLSSKNVTTGKIDWDRVKYIDNKQHVEMSKRVSPRIGDVLLAKNGTTGVAAMVDKEVVFDIYVSLALLRAKEQILPQLLLYFVNSPVAKKQFNSRLKGIGVPNLHLQEIREVEISFPKSLHKQKELILEIERFLDVTSLQNIRYKNKKNEISCLKNSILKQAFAGELVKD